MSSTEVVRLLREAYNDEMETVMNYQANSIVLDTIRAEEVKEELRADIPEELGHAQRIGERLKQLGAAPPASMDFTARQHALQPPEETTDVLSVIEGVIAAELDAIQMYRDLIEAAQDAGDPVTEDLAVQLLADEEAHRTKFQGYKKEFDRS